MLEQFCLYFVNLVFRKCRKKFKVDVGGLGELVRRITSDHDFVLALDNSLNRWVDFKTFLYALIYNSYKEFTAVSQHSKTTQLCFSIVIPLLMIVCN